MQRDRLSNFVLTLAIVGAILGALFGAIGFILSLFGGEVFIEFGRSFNLTGVAAGIVGIPLMPIAFGAMGAVVGLLCYVPYRAIRNAVRGG